MVKKQEMRTVHRRPLEARYHGRVPYRRALAWQEERVSAVQGGAAEALFLLEHEPVVTLGRTARREHLLASEAELQELGIEVIECSRGGDVTYHGPGQLVAYPILDLTPDRMDLGQYLRDLEEVNIRTLGRYGLEGERIEGLTGVWVNGEKVAAIGVRVARWVTSHGFALNVTPDLGHFHDRIVPCGIHDRSVTSLARLLESPPGLEEVARKVAEEFAEVFGRDLRSLSITRSGLPV